MKKNLIFIGCGILFLVTTGMIYIPKFMVQGLMGIELTFLSNFAAGFLFVWGGWIGIQKKKQLPQACYLGADCILIYVLLVSVACIGEARFDGPFLFLHLLNPVIATVLTVAYTYQKPIRILKTGLITIVIATLYFIYAIAYGYSSGDWLYSVINIPEQGVLRVALFYTVAASTIPVLEYILYRGSKWANRSRSLSPDPDSGSR